MIQQLHVNSSAKTPKLNSLYNAYNIETVISYY